MSLKPESIESKISHEAASQAITIIAKSPFLVQTSYSTEEAQQFKNKVKTAVENGENPGSTTEYALALIYLEGRLLPYSKEKAQNLLLRASEDGHTAAQVLVGRLFLHDCSEEQLKDPQIMSNACIQWLRRAAEPSPSEEFPTDVAIANRVLANFYHHVGNYEAAFHCLLEGASRRDPYSQLTLTLSNYYWKSYNGDAKTANINKILSWLKQARNLLKSHPLDPGAKIADILLNIGVDSFLNTQSPLRYVAPFYLEGHFTEINTHYLDIPGRGLECQGPIKKPNIAFILPEDSQAERGFKTLAQDIFLCVPPHSRLLAPFGFTTIDTLISCAHNTMKFALLCPTVKDHQVLPVTERIAANPDWMKLYGITFLTDIVDALRHCHIHDVPHGNLNINNMLATEKGLGFLVRGRSAQINISHYSGIYSASNDPFERDIFELGLAIFKLYTQSIRVYDTEMLYYKLSRGPEAQLPEIALFDNEFITSRLSACPPKMIEIMQQCLNSDPKFRPTLDRIAAVLHDLKKGDSKEAVEQSMTMEESYAKLWCLPKLDPTKSLRLIEAMPEKRRQNIESAKLNTRKFRLLELPSALLRTAAEFLDNSSIFSMLEVCKSLHQKLIAVPKKLKARILLNYQPNDIDCIVLPKTMTYTAQQSALWVKILRIQAIFHRDLAILQSQRNTIIATGSDETKVTKEISALTFKFADLKHPCALCDAKDKAIAYRQHFAPESSIPLVKIGTSETIICGSCSDKVVSERHLKCVDPLLLSVSAQELASIPHWQTKAQEKYFCISDLKVLQESLKLRTKKTS